MLDNNNASINILLFICFILIIALYDMYTEKEKAVDLLYEAQDVINYQNKAISTQSMYFQYLRQQDNYPKH
tara:strand:- start:2364 stop:2576 length:213 start_codon:yes stop_codon:yes gene_type:complete